MRYFRQERHSRQQCFEKREDRGERPNCGGIRGRRRIKALDLWMIFFSLGGWHSSGRLQQPGGRGAPAQDRQLRQTLHRPVPQRPQVRGAAGGDFQGGHHHVCLHGGGEIEKAGIKGTQTNLKFSEQVSNLFFPISRGNSRTLRPPLRRLRPPSERRAPRW